MHVTGLYAALATALVLSLALRISLLRGRTRIGFGDGGHQGLARAIRAHANALENLPLALLLLLVLELNRTAAPWLHAFGLMLIVGRLAHAAGLSRSAGASAGRTAGALLTWFAMTAMSALLLWQWLAPRVAG